LFLNRGSAKELSYLLLLSLFFFFFALSLSLCLFATKTKTKFQQKKTKKKEKKMFSKLTSGPKVLQCVQLFVEEFVEEKKEFRIFRRLEVPHSFASCPRVN
jgi:hypothetical protein